ncbi:hypothetical protein N9Y42_10770, partial [Mariniblastus sp.]|nr:hypothetical protein [Mariniblastus sp.]
STNRASFKTGPCPLEFGDGRPKTVTVADNGYTFNLTCIPGRLDYFEVGDVPYVTRRLRHILESEGAKAEYFFGGNGGKGPVYAINGLVSKTCVDKNSCTWEYDKWSGRNRIVEFALDNSRVPDEPLFKPRHPRFLDLCVSEQLKLAIEECELTIGLANVKVVHAVG